MPKKIVHYDDTKDVSLHKGKSAWIYPVDHPDLSNKKLAVTSVVLSVKANGEFETMNTIYRPLSQKRK